MLKHHNIVHKILSTNKSRDNLKYSHCILWGTSWEKLTVVNLISAIFCALLHLIEIEADDFEDLTTTGWDVVFKALSEKLEFEI